MSASACDGTLDATLFKHDLQQTLDSFHQADRVIIQDRRSDSAIKTIVIPEQLKDVFALFDRNHAGWMAFRGAGGEYDLFFYRGSELLGRAGVTHSSDRLAGRESLNVDNYFRRVREEESHLTDEAA